MGIIKDITGQRFDKLIAKSFSHLDNQNASIWLFECECGTSKLIRAKDVKAGKISSCGCKKIEMVRAKNYKHGNAERDKTTPTYNSWRGMIERCTNPSNISYKNYGGKGIKVYQSWLVFENFLSDMGEAPAGMTIERISIEGNYEPNNCKWASRHEQSRNHSRNVNITCYGRTQCLQDWANEVGINSWTIHCRVFKRNWSVKKALETPTKGKKIK